MYFSYEHALSKVESDFIEEKKEGGGEAWRGEKDARERRRRRRKKVEGERKEGLNFALLPPSLPLSEVDANYSAKMHLRARGTRPLILYFVGDSVSSSATCALLLLLLLLLAA